MKKGKLARPKLPPASEQMKAWSAALADELMGWPQVSTRAFFGFAALYRNQRIFGLLPRTRGMETANSLAFKLEVAPPAMRARWGEDPRIGSTEMRQTRWFTFELSSDSDLHDALDWLGRAYEAAGKSKKSC
jgi:hypothetical protein